MPVYAVCSRLLIVNVVETKMDFKSIRRRRVFFLFEYKQEMEEEKTLSEDESSIEPRNRYRLPYSSIIKM